MFKLGDRVHCSFNDKDGTVIDTNNPESLAYPIEVKFDDNSTDCYTETGHWQGMSIDDPDLIIIS